MARKTKGHTRAIGVNLDKLSHEIRDIMLDVGMEIVEELSIRVAKEASENAPVIQETPLLPGQQLRRGANKHGKSDSGPLRGSVFAVESQKVPLSWLIVAPAWYAHFVEYGTEPHIMPRRGEKTMWFRGADGKAVKTNTVNHPGMKMKPFLRPAADKAEQIVRQILAERGM